MKKVYKNGVKAVLMPTDTIISGVLSDIDPNHLQSLIRTMNYSNKGYN